MALVRFRKTEKTRVKDARNIRWRAFARRIHNILFSATTQMTRDRCSKESDAPVAQSAHLRWLPDLCIYMRELRATGIFSRIPRRKLYKIRGALNIQEDRANGTDEKDKINGDTGGIVAILSLCRLIMNVANIYSFILKWWIIFREYFVN